LTGTQFTRLKSLSVTGHGAAEESWHISRTTKQAEAMKAKYRMFAVDAGKMNTSKVGIIKLRNSLARPLEGADERCKAGIEG